MIIDFIQSCNAIKIEITILTIINIVKMSSKKCSASDGYNYNSYQFESCNNKCIVELHADGYPRYLCYKHYREWYNWWQRMKQHKKNIVAESMRQKNNEWEEDLYN